MFTRRGLCTVYTEFVITYKSVIRNRVSMFNTCRITWFRVKVNLPIVVIIYVICDGGSNVKSLSQSIHRGKSCLAVTCDDR